MKRWTSQNTDEIGSRIAMQWLKFADATIERGHRPGRLSEDEELIRDMISEYSTLHGLEYPSKQEQKKIKELALHWAREWLRDGRFPLVLDFFKNKERQAMNKRMIASELVKIAEMIDFRKGGEHPYHEHFRENLKEHGKESPAEFGTDEEKRHFFEEVKGEWQEHPENTAVASELVKIAKELIGNDFVEVDIGNEFPSQKIKRITYNGQRFFVFDRRGVFIDSYNPYDFPDDVGYALGRNYARAKALRSELMNKYDRLIPSDFIKDVESVEVDFSRADEWFFTEIKVKLSLNTDKKISEGAVVRWAEGNREKIKKLIPRVKSPVGDYPSPHDMSWSDMDWRQGNNGDNTVGFLYITSRVR